MFFLYFFPVMFFLFPAVSALAQNSGNISMQWVGRPYTMFLCLLALIFSIVLLILCFVLKRTRERLFRERRNHQKTMESLIARERKARRIFDSVNDFIYTLDLEGNFLEMNAACEKALGRRILANKTFNVKDIVPAPFDQKVDEFLENIRKTGNIRGYIRVKRPDGRHVLLEHVSSLLYDDEGTPTAVQGVARDVTEHYFTKKALERSEKRYRDILESIEEGYYEVDIKGNLKFFNPAFAKMLGWTEKELEGGNYSDFLDEVEAQILYEAFHSVFLSGRPKKAMECSLKRKDETDCYLEISISPVKDAATGKIIGFRGIIRDITKRVEAVKRQRELESQLAVAERMEAIGALASGIAHDFNNILFPIIGFTEMTMSDLPKGDQVRENLENVLQSAYRAKSLVRQILTFGSEQEDQASGPVSPRPVVHETISLLRKTTPSSIEIRTDYGKEIPEVRILPTRLQRLVMNLCTNAVQAMAPLEIGRLVVTLSARDVSAEEASDLSGLSPGRYVILTVSDTGPGIPEDIRDKIFEPYFSTKPRDKGSGLGLSIAWGIVKNAGGGIFLKTAPGGGALFEVYLPAVSRENEPKKEAYKAVASSSNDHPRGRETILLVDDEQEVIQVEKQILKSLGYTVIPRTSSIEALEAFKFDPDRIDLVITDYTMPNMTGLKLADEITKIRPDIPVILCTGFSEQVTEEKAARAGVRHILMKPLSIRELAHAVRNAIDG